MDDVGWYDLRSTERWDASLCQLLADTFGPRDDQRELPTRWRDDPRRHVLMAVDDGEVVGASIVGLVPDLEGRARYLEFDPDFNARLGEGPLGEFNTLAVAPRWRRRGLGRALAGRHQALLRDLGAVGWAGICWDNGAPDSSKHLYEGAGFEALGRIPGYFRRFHEASGQRCPYCAPSPCDCVAILYARRG